MADVGKDGLQDGVVRLLGALYRVSAFGMMWKEKRTDTYAERRKLEPEDEDALERIVPEKSREKN